MKQRIEPADLEGLTDAQKDRLRELLEPNQYDITLNEDGYIFIWPDVDKFDDDCPDVNDYLPLLSVGQMIEIFPKLIDHNNEDHTDLLLIINESLFVGNTKLCDVLWQAVKEIL